MPGFTRGRNLEKIGLKSSDTAELFFDQVPVPAANVLGRAGQGFYHLMHNLPSERLSSAQYRRFPPAEGVPQARCHLPDAAGPAAQAAGHPMTPRMSRLPA
jgi:hypothetical protein